MKSYFKLVDDYILENLSPKEHEEFEEELAKKPALQARVKLCRELKDSVVENDIHLLRDKLNKSKHLYAKRTGKIKKRIIFISTAASILLLFSIKLLFFGAISNHEKTYQKHYQPYQIVGDYRESIPDNTTNLSSKLVNLYISKQYEDVVNSLELYLAQNPKDFQAILMLTTSLLETENAKKAERLLNEQLPNNNNIMYKETIMWYYGLSLLKQGKTNTAKRIFKSIAHEKGLYSQEALSIIDTL